MEGEIDWTKTQLQKMHDVLWWHIDVLPTKWLSSLSLWRINSNASLTENKNFTSKLTIQPDDVT